MSGPTSKFHETSYWVRTEKKYYKHRNTELCLVTVELSTNKLREITLFSVIGRKQRRCIELAGRTCVVKARGQLDRMCITFPVEQARLHKTQ